MQPSNGLFIEDFIYDKHDNLLPIYFEFLKLLASFDEIRPVNTLF